MLRSFSHFPAELLLCAALGLHKEPQEPPQALPACTGSFCVGLEPHGLCKDISPFPPLLWVQAAAAVPAWSVQDLSWLPPRLHPKLTVPPVDGSSLGGSSCPCPLSGNPSAAARAAPEPCTAPLLPCMPSTAPHLCMLVTHLAQFC